MFNDSLFSSGISYSALFCFTLTFILTFSNFSKTRKQYETLKATAFNSVCIPLIYLDCWFPHSKFITHNDPYGKACYHSVQNLLPSKLMSKNIKIQICWTYIWSVFMWIWNFIFHIEERNLNMFENIERRGRYLSLRGTK